MDEDLQLEYTLNVYKDYNDLPNEAYCIKIQENISVLLDLMMSLTNDEIKVQEWQIWTEYLIYKLANHASSIIKLHRGTEIPYKKEDEGYHIIFDEPSILILYRAFLENYLTFFYLYTDSISDNEKEFRVLVWVYSGLKQRSDFKVITEYAKIRKYRESEEVAKLKERVLRSSFFQQYNKKQKDKIIAGLKPRLEYGWGKLVKNSNLRDSYFSNLYEHHSSYSHSEFISVLQFKEGGYGHTKDNNRSHHLLLIMHGLVCKAIMDLTIVYPSIKSQFLKLNSTKIYEIESLNGIIINSDFNRELDKL